jgi:hypothetical protein
MRGSNEFLTENFNLPPMLLTFLSIQPSPKKNKIQLDSNLLSKGLNGAKKKHLRIKLKIFKIMLL